MLITMQRDCSPAVLDRTRQVLESLGCRLRAAEKGPDSALIVVSATRPPDPELVRSLKGVASVEQGTVPACRASISSRPGGTRIEVGPVTIGGGRLTVIAGPCAVEDEDRLVDIARRMKDAGVDLLRGGAYKPRTNPYDFQGLGERGLRMLAAARHETGLPVVTEAVDEASLERVEEHADVIQIGARNMHNYALLKRAGRCSRPVFLKRGFAASLDDLLQAAEYVLDAGNPRVMLCERGIRTFSDHSRFTLDLAIVPRLKRRTHLPVFVDPSHATGVRDSVVPLARAAVACGADGLMVEVHPEPERAACDGPQALDPASMPSLVRDLRELSALVARREEVAS
jgi:3-deoxy-7-phosphoheptulonate synthase